MHLKLKSFSFYECYLFGVHDTSYLNRKNSNISNYLQIQQTKKQFAGFALLMFKISHT